MNVFAPLVAALVLTGVQDSKSRDRERVYLESLKSAELNSLLEVRCRRALQNSDLPEDSLSTSISFLADRMNFEGLRAATRESRDDFWKRSDSLVEEYSKARGMGKRTALARYQQTGCWLRRTQLLNEQSKLAPAEKSFPVEAMGWAQKSADVSQEIAKTLQAEETRRKKKGAVSADDLTPDQLYSLSRAATFRQAASWIAVANLTTDAEKKQSLLAQADRLLGTFLKDINTNPLTLEAMLARAEVNRQKEETNKAEAAYKRILTMKECPPAYMDAARLAWAKLMVQLDREGEAIPLIEAGGKDKLANPELAIVYFEALVKRYSSQSASEAKAAETTLETAMEVMDDLAGQGSYWKRRCQNLLVGKLKASRSVSHAGLAVQLAELHRRQNQPEEALAMFDRAAELYKSSDRPTDAKETKLVAANYAFDVGDNEQAIQRIENYSSEFPDDSALPRASITLARSYLRKHAKTKDQASFDKARETLERHLRKYRRDQEITPQVDWLLAQIYEREGNSKKALEHYLLVPASHASYIESLEAIAGTLHRHVDANRKETPERRKSIFRSAADDIEKRLAVLPKEERSLPQERSLAIARIALAEIWLEPELAQYAQAAKMLSETVLALPDGAIPRELATRAWISQMRAAVRAGFADAATASIKTIDDDRVASLLGLYAEFAPLDDRTSAMERAAQCKVIDATADQLLEKNDLLTPADRIQVKLLYAQSLAVRGEIKRAESILQKLRSESPRDARVLESLARAQFAAKRYSESRTAWMTLMRGYPRGEAPWFEALYEVARCHVEDGKPQKALEFIATAEALFPELGGPASKTRFEAIKAQAQKKSAK